MAGDKSEKAEHAENAEHMHSAEHEVVLTGVVALAGLFSNCVEAFGLILPSHKWEKQEQLLLCRLGIQQARLLIWGDVVGVTSPPATVTDRAVPKHPSAAYPDLKEPTFFGARDERLDDPDTRKTVEDALSAIVDRSSSATREEMMEKYGLRPPKKFAAEYHPALDTNRLEAFREHYELLKEVAETYAHISTRRTSSITHTTWAIADNAQFGSFIKLTQDKVDSLIRLMDAKEKVDRAMRMDIKALGWHLSADRQRVAIDVSKLRLMAEACKDEYPEYLQATEQALQNIDREKRENTANYNPYATSLATPVSTPHTAANTARRGSTPLVHAPAHTNGNTTNGEKHNKRPGGLFGGLFKSLGKKKNSHPPRSQSVSTAKTSSSADNDPERSQSDAGPVRSASNDSMEPIEPSRSKSVGAEPEDPPATYVRSKSVGDILETQPETDEEAHALQNRLEKWDTHVTAAATDDVLENTATFDSAISRHDQFHGLGRQGTKTQW